MVRVVRLERTVSWSQTRRDTNFAIPGYSFFCHDTMASDKNKDFSVCGHLCGQRRFCAVFSNREKPAIACVTRLCGVSPHPIPDTTTALPKQARYQLRYTRLFRCFIRLVVFSQSRRATNCAAPRNIYFYLRCNPLRLALLARLAVPEKILALFACSIFSTAERAV